MNAHRLLILCAGIATLSLGFCGAFNYMDPQSNDIASAAKQTRYESTHKDDEAVANPAIVELKQQLASVKTELDTLKGTRVNTDQIYTALDRLNEDVRSLKQKLEAGAKVDEYAEAPFGAKAGADPVTVTKQSLLEAAEEQQHRDFIHLDYIEQQFQAEEVDQVWSRETADLISGTVNDLENLQTDLSYVQCQSTMCLVEVKHRDALAADEFVLHFSTQVGAALPQTNFYTQEQSDGSISMVMYLARKGHFLPRPPSFE